MTSSIKVELCSLTHSLTRLFTPLLKHSFTNSLTHSLTHSGMEPLAKTQLIQSLVKLLEDTGIISTEIFQGEVRRDL